MTLPYRKVHSEAIIYHSKRIYPFFTIPYL